MNFLDLQHTLLDLIRRRVSNGSLTERGLARMSGLSQPHIHNALKKIRLLSVTSTDRLMSTLNLTVGDLLGVSAHSVPSAEFVFVPVPLLRGRIGPGSNPLFGEFRGYFPAASSVVSTLVDPVAARLARDLVLPAACSPDDVVLLDQNPASRAHPASGIWVVAEDAMGLRVRYARLVNLRLYVFHEANLAEPAQWGIVPLAGRNILDIVRAQIVWIGRDLRGPPDSPL